MEHLDLIKISISSDGTSIMTTWKTSTGRIVSYKSQVDLGNPQEREAIKGLCTLASRYLKAVGIETGVSVVAASRITLRHKNPHSSICPTSVKFSGIITTSCKGVTPEDTKNVDTLFNGKTWADDTIEGGEDILNTMGTIIPILSKLYK